MKYKHILGFAVAFIVITLIFLFAFYLRLLLAPFLVAYVLQFALRPLINMLEQRGIKHTAAVTIVFASAFLLFALLLSVLIPAIVSELSNVQANIENYTGVLIKKYHGLQTKLLSRTGLLKIFLGDKSIVDEFTTYLKNNLLFFIQKIPQHIFNFLPMILYIVVIPFATFFFLLDAQRIKKKIIGFVPNRYFEMSLNIIHSLHRQFGMLLRGMFISAVIISLLATAGLWIIGLEYPLLVGLFSGLANLIPYFGPVAGTIAACLVAIVTGSPPVFFLYILLVFLTVNLIDNVLVQPMVLARAANLHPLIVIFLVLAGSKIGGILGMLLAVPLVSLIRVVINILYNKLTRPVRPDFSKYVDIAETFFNNSNPHNFSG